MLQLWTSSGTKLHFATQNTILTRGSLNHSVTNLDNGYAWLQGMQPNPNLNLNLSPNPIPIPNPNPILIQALRVTGEMCKASVRVKH